MARNCPKKKRPQGAATHAVMAAPDERTMCVEPDGFVPVQRRRVAAAAAAAGARAPLPRPRPAPTLADFMTKSVFMQLGEYMKEEDGDANPEEPMRPTTARDQSRVSKAPYVYSNAPMCNSSV